MATDLFELTAENEMKKLVARRGDLPACLGHSVCFKRP
jgi:hypothetical protein